ncbi:hypothetical protein [Rhodoglobus vestalii]|nr:hypothetical protein [Rhodoglobus vestalii]
MKSIFLNGAISPGYADSGVEGSIFRQLEPVTVALISSDNAIASDTNGLSRTDTLEHLGTRDEAGFRTEFVIIGDFCLSGVTPFGSRQRLQVFTILSLLGCIMFAWLKVRAPSATSEVVLQFLTPPQLDG